MTNEDSDASVVRSALKNLVAEAFLHAGPHGGWFLNPGEPGFVEQLAMVTAERASTPPAEGRKTIASHASHMLYHLTLLNRWAAGEPNPFADAKWAASWDVVVVSPEAWDDLRGDLKREANAWLSAIESPRSMNEIEWTGAFASAAHAAYHLGAVRQMLAWIGREPA